jgi:hypothetical protein
MSPAKITVRSLARDGFQRRIVNHFTNHQSRITFVRTNRFAALTHCAPTLRSFLAQMAG